MTLPPILTNAFDHLEVIDAIQTDRDHHFAAQNQHAPVWLALTPSDLFELAALPDGTCWQWRHELESLRIQHERGLIKDSVIIEDQTFEVPVGAGKKSKQFVRRVQNQQHDQPKQIKPLLNLWFEMPPDALHPLIRRDKTKNSPILAASSVTPGEQLANAQQAWLIITSMEALLYWWSEDTPQAIGNAQLMRLDHHTPIDIQTSLTRDSFSLGGRTLFTGPLIGTGSIRQLASWAGLPPDQRLMTMAQLAMTHSKWLDANELLSHLPTHTTKDTDLDLYHLKRAHIALSLGEDARVLKHLIALTARRPDDNLITLSQSHFTPPQTWWFNLALAHEEATDHKAAADVYGHITTLNPALDIFLLQQARNLRLAQQDDEAIDIYTRFIYGRLDGNEFSLISYYAQHADNLEEASSDPDLAQACAELGQLYESRNQLPEAARLYLTYIRQAPFDHMGYERLFQIADQLGETNHRFVTQAATILMLLDPKRAHALFEDLEIEPLSWASKYWMTHTKPIDDKTHQDHIVHEGERASGALAQKWLSQLITDPRSTSDIELHCQRLTIQSHEALITHLASVAQMLSLPQPRVYLSHGMSGVQVMGDKNTPFVLMGAIHLDENNPQSLSARELVFALSSQIEHIKAGHLMLTSSEFWSAFRSRSLDGLVTALSLIPIGGMLGKVTDKFAGSLIGKLRTGWDNAMVKQLASVAEKSLKDGTGGHVQGAYEATLGRVATLGKTKISQESLLKEQLADFARCAMYTADRVGLIACDDLNAAVSAILRLSTRTHEHVQTLQSDGLMTLLEQKDERGELVYVELALRLGELFKFALSDEYLTLRKHLHGAPPQMTNAPEDQTPLDEADPLAEHADRPTDP